MKITYDPEVKAVYICLTDDEVKANTTTPLTPLLSVDYNFNTPIGIEVLDVDKLEVEVNARPS